MFEVLVLLNAASDTGATPSLEPGAGLPPRAGPEAHELARSLSVSVTLGDWLVQRRFRDVELARCFLNPRLADLSRPEGMLDRAPAAERIAAAIRAGQRITVFGDYDCDGMTSAAILTEMLRTLGGEVRTLLASRFDGGYGVSATALARIRESGAKLLVTCDCGSSDHERLADLMRSGVDVIVIDHHLVPAEPLPVLAFLNPHRPECGFAYKGLASCGLVLSIGAAVRSVLGRELELRSWLDLVAIGTIADVAPLDGDNRSLVRAGLRALGEARRPGIRALLGQAKLSPSAALSAEDVAFRLAPRLNAPGRLGAPDAALELLLAPNLESASLLAARLEQASSERKAVQERILLEATQEIERDGLADRSAIVLGREGWNHGIVGIVAGRLADRFARPVVVVGFQAGKGRGSVRGPAGARLYDALARAEGTTLRFGGHQAAAGVELELSRLQEFREAFEAAVRSLAPQTDKTASTLRDCVWLACEDEPRSVLRDLALLEPCGATNPAPALLIDAALLSAREVTGGHLKMELELSGGRRLSAFGIALGQHAGTLKKRVSVRGRLRPDRFRGGDALELFVERIIEGG